MLHWEKKQNTKYNSPVKIVVVSHLSESPPVVITKVNEIKAKYKSCYYIINKKLN